jgi:Flp pilus assembly protein TadB
MRGPPITVTCECGEARALQYGERWTCESCGRRWNTEQIPEAEYSGLVRDLRRYRLQMVGAGLVAAAVLVVLVVFVDEGLVLVVPVLFGLAAILYGPVWKRRVRRRIAERPRWQLHPE